MNSERLTTSLDTETKIIELQRAFKMSTKAAIMRIAIGLSLRNNEDPRIKYPESENDHNGATYQRITITGNYDELYKDLLIEHLEKNIPENELFPGLLNSHISRGVNLLYNEYKLKGNSDKVIESIFKLI